MKRALRASVNVWLRALGRAAFGASDKLTRPPVLIAFALLYAAVIAVVGVARLAAVSGPLSPDAKRVVTGDYLSFLVGATIVAGPEPRTLYDPVVQRDTWRQLAGASLDFWQGYPYPPLIAIAMSPLPSLPFKTGYLAFIGASLFAGLAATISLLTVVKAMAASRWNAIAIVALVLAFHPVATTMFAGHVTAFVLALLCGSLAALQSGRSWLAGVLLGTLSFKPQYVPLLALLLAVDRCWPAVATATGIGVAHWLLGAALVSPRWPLDLMSLVNRFGPVDWARNGGNHFSLPRFFDFVAGGATGTVLAGLSIAAVVVAVLRFAPRVAPGDPDFPLAWSLVLVASMLAMPHLAYYDFGILALPVAVAIDTTLRRGAVPGFAIRTSIAVAYVGFAWFAKSASTLGFQPLTLWTLALFAWLCWLGAAPIENRVARPAG